MIFFSIYFYLAITVDTRAEEEVIDCITEEDGLQVVKITRRVQVPDAEEYIRRFSLYSSRGPSGAHFNHSEGFNLIRSAYDAPTGVPGPSSPREQLRPLDPSADEVIVVRSDRPDPLLASQANKKPQTRIKEGRPNNSQGQP